MTAQLLATELANLIQESKRKHHDLRQAAEKSLEELKSLRTSSEAQTAAGRAPLASSTHRANFVNPFIIACGTKNAKFTGIAVVCLQRLIVAKALPRPRLNQVLEALREATSAGLDVQLKILQALPSLLQNYSAEVNGDLLVTALNICFILQSSKNAIVNNTSAATLQQLVVSVFDKVVVEDKSSSDAPTVGEAPTQEGTVALKASALDAFRVFNDLCLLTELQRPEYLRFSGLSQTFGLELIESVLTNHAAIFTSHPEQTHVLRTRVMPLLINSLSGHPNFATSVRLMRILYTLLRRHLSLLPSESADALDVLTQILDQDTTIWRRALCMEVFRGIFSEPALLRRIFMMYDGQEGEKKILKNLTATFVRVSTERPAIIGLGHQSTIPVANPYANVGTSTDQAALEASGVTGFISSSVGGEGHDTGISTQWSSVRVPCIDQLDKTESPAIPESYLYSLTLSCINSLSEGLAKFILPLTVPTDVRNRKRNGKQDATGRDSPAPGSEERVAGKSAALERSSSFKKNPVPINPLTLEDHPLYQDIKASAALIEECWPAILATCSTFLYAALDSDYYHGLVRAFQKFTHVAGLLQLDTPRDAFLTTLGKAAVPPNVFTACLNAGPRPSTPTPTTETPNSILGNARGLLSVDSLVSQASSNQERQRQPSVDAAPSTLNTRNMLCLRALLNLGIALGPTLSSSWQIILETLQQADFVLFASGKVAGRTPIVSRTPDQQAENETNMLLANFGSEIKAVETAASRLFESTVDFPNSSFVEVITAVCNLLDKNEERPSTADSRPQSPPSGGSTLKAPGGQHRRVLSISTTAATGPNQEDQFALAKLGDIATINLERLLSYPPESSGWVPLTSELIETLSSSSASSPVRLRAAEILVRLVLESFSAVTSRPTSDRAKIQLRLLQVLDQALRPLQNSDRNVSVTAHAADLDIHRTILEGLRSILENCGESLVSGWDLAFAIIDSIFLSKRFAAEEGAILQADQSVLMTRSVKLIKPAFSSLQLICSDFLSSLPNICFLNLVDTLYKFCSQDDELNVALTTVTFFWVISDFLSGRSQSITITEAMMEGFSDKELTQIASDSARPGSSAALWMLLLHRLTIVATDSRLELRNSAIQTLLRIVHAYGSSLNPDSWAICIKSVIFRLLESMQKRLASAHEESHGPGGTAEWDETAVVVIDGVSGLFASYLDVLTVHKNFNSLWKHLLGCFGSMLDFKSLEINSAVFNSLASILSKCNTGSAQNLKTDSIDIAWELWSRGVPQSPGGEVKTEDQQKSLLSWVEALLQMYRLIAEDLQFDRVKTILRLLREAMLLAMAGSYASDIEFPTQLQGRILDFFKTTRTDISEVPAAIIAQLAEFVALAFTDERIQLGSSQKQQTFVAMSKESMKVLKYHITQNASDTHIFTEGAFSAALSALAKPITLKYRFPIVTKSTQPWQEATSAALAVLEATIPHLQGQGIPRPTVREIWQVIVSIAAGIISADAVDAAPAGADLAADERFDIDAFRALRELVIPLLGADAAVAEKTRRAYAEALFRTSVIHAPAPSEAGLFVVSTGTGTAAPDTDPARRGQLAGLLHEPLRVGRTAEPPPARREAMAYECLQELFALVAARDDDAAASTPTIVVQPPTPRFPPPQMTLPPGHGRGHGHGNKSHGDGSAMHAALARTAAPYLIVRCALSLRAYAADQPLRGHMPQPLSQRREMGAVLRALVDLRSEPGAIPDSAGVECEGRKHLLRLYPLLVRCAGVAGAAGDDKVLGLVGDALGVVGGELGL
ncbi:uncharacterized protein E0L32_005231 [Thyridium curvatum]|uniref:Endosomal peripheral membrane protein n=1 Tax=Thyridium curvatum TaxID=1093900 RepID=A0A507BAZ2_9PEZI|nr:uncharacterized protein E0L32_005231 [Thyridium curvatum]TPX14539.1 hypothetical protein E0L32_005231 [Thyridium curvatum]